MAFFTPAALLAAGSLATGIAGTGIAAANAQTSNGLMAAQGRAGVMNAENQQRYQQALNAIAMQRGVAGSQDGMGNTTAYDPATNSWKTTLSPEQFRLQSAADQASISRNTTDLATSQEANRNAMHDSIAASSAAGPALAAIRNYRPLTSQGLEGQLQETATTANRQAQDPVIADTLRQFARTGSAAGPVLTNMMRDNATSLRQTMLTDKIDAMKNVGAINSANLGSLDNNYQTLNQAAKPQLNFSPIDGSNPNAQLLSAMTARASGAAQPASMGAYSSSASTGAFNNANQLGLAHPQVSGLGTGIQALGTQLDGLSNPNNPLIKAMTGSGGGPSWLGSMLGTNKMDAAGNTIGQDQLTPNWQNTMFGIGGDNNNAGNG